MYASSHAEHAIVALANQPLLPAEVTAPLPGSMQPPEAPVPTPSSESKPGLHDVTSDIRWDTMSDVGRRYSSYDFVPTQTLSPHIRYNELLPVGAGAANKGHLPAVGKIALSLPTLGERHTERLDDLLGKTAFLQPEHAKMEGAYRTMVISGRKPVHTADETARQYGFHAAELASVELPFRGQIARDAKAAQIARDHELVLFDTALGKHGEATYMVTTRSFLDRYQSASRVVRGAMLRSGEVRHLKNGDVLPIGRGVEELPDGRRIRRWLPPAVALHTEQTYRDQRQEGLPPRHTVSDRQALMSVVDGHLVYQSRAFNVETFRGRKHDAEKHYDTAFDTNLNTPSNDPEAPITGKAYAEAYAALPVRPQQKRVANVTVPGSVPSRRASGTRLRIPRRRSGDHDAVQHDNPAKS